MVGWAVPQGSPCHQIGGVLANTGRAASRGPSNVPWLDGMGWWIRNMAPEGLESTAGWGWVGDIITPGVSLLIAIRSVPFKEVLRYAFSCHSAWSQQILSLCAMPVKSTSPFSGANVGPCSLLSCVFGGTHDHQKIQVPKWRYWTL